MNIGFIVNNYPPHLGGVEQHVHHLAAELAQRGHNIFVMTLAQTSNHTADKIHPASQKNTNAAAQKKEKTAKSPQKKGSIRILRVPRCMNIGDVFSLPTLQGLRTIIQAAKKAELDIISVHTRFFPLTWLGVALGHHYNIPVLFTEHGSDFVVHDSRLVTIAAKVIDYTCGRWSLRHATQVLGVSNAVTSFVQKLAHTDSSVFFNAVPPSNPQIPRHSAQHLVFIGRLVHGKGWNTFIRIAAALKEEIPAISATIIGSGPDEEQVRALSPSWIRVTGRLSPAQAIQELSGSTLINPTILSEGFQTTVVETIVNGGRVAGYPEPASYALQRAGAPVTIVTRGDERALQEAAHQVITAPQPALSESQASEWTWPKRAEEYETLCTALLHTKKI